VAEWVVELIPRFVPRYDEIKYFVGTKRFITHSMIEIKFNLRYVESRKAIHALQEDGIISDDFNVPQGGYEVLKRSYHSQPEPAHQLEEEVAQRYN
jgi:hypothetical protein